jgi:hypothetical protein
MSAESVSPKTNVVQPIFERLSVDDYRQAGKSFKKTQNPDRKRQT